MRGLPLRYLSIAVRRTAALGLYLNPYMASNRKTQTGTERLQAFLGRPLRVWNGRRRETCPEPSSDTATASPSSTADSTVVLALVLPTAVGTCERKKE